MNIVFVAHSSFNENFVVGSHHLSRAMAAEGHTVWHIGPPVTPFHFLQASSRPSYRDRLRRSMLEPEMMDGLTSMEPMALVPWQIARRFLARGNLFVKTSNLVRRLRKVFAPGEIDILIIDDPRFAGLEQKLKPRALFYRLTDFYAEMKGDPTILEAERHLLARCAAVIATSQPVLQHALALHPGLPSLLLENGVDHAHFSTEVAEPEVLKAIPRPRVVYVGAIDFRFDVGLLDALAYRCPAMHFVMIGDGTEAPEHSSAGAAALPGGAGLPAILRCGAAAVCRQCGQFGSQSHEALRVRCGGAAGARPAHPGTGPAQGQVRAAFFQRGRGRERTGDAHRPAAGPRGHRAGLP
jgi:hypothetical protein